MLPAHSTAHVGAFGQVLTLVALLLTTPPVFAISQCSSPMVTALVAWAAGVEALSPLKLAGIAVGISAAAYRISAKENVTLSTLVATESPHLVSVVIVAFLMCAALYALLNKRLGAYNGSTITAWGFGSAAALYAATTAAHLSYLSLATDEPPPRLEEWWPGAWSEYQLWALGYAVVVCTALNFSLMTYALQQLAATTAMMYDLCEPVGTLLTLLIIQGRVPTAVDVACIVSIGAGLALVSYEELQRAADRDRTAPAAEQEPKAKPKASRSRRRRASASPSPAAPGPSMRRRRATKTPVKFDPDAPTDATYY